MRLPPADCLCSGLSSSGTLALGAYEVDAVSASGRRFHAPLLVRDLQNDPTRVEVPRIR